jgi:anti-sigma factor RsiW
MSRCTFIDALLTPYVDGELTPPDRDAVDQHVVKCPPCRGRLLAERAVRAVIADRRDRICTERAPEALRARCAALRAAAGQMADARPERMPRLASLAAPDALPPAFRLAQRDRAARPRWRARIAPLSMAAALVLIVGAAFLYQLTASSSRVMAAELTADHMKCFALNNVLGTHATAEIVESSMASTFDWPMQLPPANEGGLDLVGSRPCLYGEGRVAHIMFRHNGTPVSLFMLPKTSRADELVRVLGHEAAIWSVGDRTFVLIARETKDEVAHLADFVQASLR